MSTTQVTTETKKVNKKFTIILILFILVGGGFALYKYFHSLAHEVTDDAQIETSISPVIPKVSGYIKKIYVEDNQEVKKGDTLMIIDDADFQIKVKEAEAALLAAKSQTRVSDANLATNQTQVASSEAGANAAFANVATADANIEAAKVQVWRTTNDFERYEKLYQNQSITKQQYEQALAAKESAEKQLKILIEQKRAIEKQANQVAKQVQTTKAQNQVIASQKEVINANIKTAEANLESAKLNLSYTVIIAPIDGKVSKIDLQPGQFVQAGQALFSLIPKDQTWVVANFKETQMEHIRPGQTVEIKVDAFPHHKFMGIVNSISPATGAKFALIPPDNASGNFVKTVQRVPVKITFQKKDDELLKLVRPGMNVVVDVHIKESAAESRS